MVMSSPVWSAKLEVILQEPLVGGAPQRLLHLAPVLDRIRQRTAAHPLEHRAEWHRIDAEEALELVEIATRRQILVGDLKGRLAIREAIEVALVLVGQSKHGKRLFRLDLRRRVAVVTVGGLRNPRAGEESARGEQGEHV